MSTRIRGTTPLAALLLVTATGLPLAVSPGCSRSAGTDTPPHVEHMVLPPHKVWRVISVQPTRGWKRWSW